MNQTGSLCRVIMEFAALPGEEDMAVIRVAVDDDDPDSGHYAAAVMAAMLAQASKPLPPLPAPEKWSKPEKTLPENPKRLTLKQHVFPVRSIQRFVDQSGRVTVFDMIRVKERPAVPQDILFCARRAWDQQTEAAMTQIENRFQDVVQPIIEGQVNTIAPEHKPAIDAMFALWFMRTHFRGLAAQELQLFGVPGYDITKAHEEHLESTDRLFVRKGGKIPARQINGGQLRLRVSGYTRDLAAALSGWGVIHAQSGEFIVPDVPTLKIKTFIPLSPVLALVGAVPDGDVLEETVAEINSALKAGSYQYYFARDLSKCPFSI
ncbi:hypothetical protein [Paraburkholderia sp. CI3]|uniref:hypothetical protein n=1 Tax=Paraburkholderia sp. CI3 TaxID=2991060 RepID=UPI003D1FE606